MDTLLRTARAVTGSAEGGHNCDVVYLSEYQKGKTAQDVDDVRIVYSIHYDAQIDTERPENHQQFCPSLILRSLSKFHVWLYSRAH